MNEPKLNARHIKNILLNGGVSAALGFAAGLLTRGVLMVDSPPMDGSDWMMIAVLAGGLGVWTAWQEYHHPQS